MSVQSIIGIGFVVLFALLGVVIYFTLKSKEKWKAIAKDALATINGMRIQKEADDQHADRMRKRLGKLEDTLIKIERGELTPHQLNDLRSGKLPY